jgi:hypothetical protein
MSGTHFYSGKAPRQYADEILGMRTAAERKRALEAIEDPKVRAIARFYVEDYFAKRFKRPLPDLNQITAEEMKKQQQREAARAGIRQVVSARGGACGRW